MALTPSDLAIAAGCFTAAAGLNILAELRPKLRPSTVGLVGIALGIVGAVLGAVLALVEAA